MNKKEIIVEEQENKGETRQEIEEWTRTGRTTLQTPVPSFTTKPAMKRIVAGSELFFLILYSDVSRLQTEGERKKVQRMAGEMERK